MRASRLLSILMLLQTRSRVSATELAAHLEVSVRTVHRDIEQLSAAGVPVYAERGRTGGYRLLDGWQTKLTGLTEDEAQAMFLAGLPGPAAELGLGEAMGAAQLKLTAALPAGWQLDARRVSSRVHLDPVGWYQAPDTGDHLRAVAGAVWTERVLEVRYESWRGVSTRRLHPLGMVIKAGTWYLVASTPPSTEPRTYRLSNMLDVVTTDERFDRPASFDLGGYWEASTRAFERDVYRAEAEIRVTTRGLRHLRRLDSAFVDASGRAVRDGRRHHRVTIPIESVERASEALLPLGTEVEVLSPPALRDHMSGVARALVTLYGSAR